VLVHCISVALNAKQIKGPNEKWTKSHTKSTTKSEISPVFRWTLQMCRLRYAQASKGYNGWHVHAVQSSPTLHCSNHGSATCSNPATEHKDWVAHNEEHVNAASSVHAQIITPLIQTTRQNMTRHDSCLSSHRLKSRPTADRCRSPKHSRRQTCNDIFF